MTIGERIKIARQAANLSLRALAEEVGVSAMAISKYERDLDTPSSSVLLRLARALNLKAEYFFRTRQVTLSLPCYRKRVSLPKKQERALLAQIQGWLERYLEVESFFASEKMPVFYLPEKLKLQGSSLEKIEAVEDVAQTLRQEWKLGLDPIENVVELLEDQGIKIGLAGDYDDFDACTIWANENVPIIAVKRNLPGDRQRFDLAHELGHLVLETAEKVDAEKAAHRFAGAFLVPAPAALYELGERRNTLDLHELYLLKHKYGLSMQGWIYRAKELGVISESTADGLFQLFGRKGWRKSEPGDQLPSETPKRMTRLVLRALAEDLISEARAAELLDKPLTQFWQEEERQRVGFPASVRG